MDTINTFTSNIEDIRDCLKGSWGTEIGNDYKLTYLGNIVIGEGSVDLLNDKIKKNIYEWKSIGDNLYIGWIK